MSPAPTFNWLFMTVALIVTGCSMDNAERLERVKPGMTPEQVERYLGPPIAVGFVFGDMAGAFATYRWNSMAKIQPSRA